MTPDESTDSVRVAAGDLAAWLRDWRLEDCEHASNYRICCAPCLRDRILASDWLADVVARAKAEALREAAAHVEDECHFSSAPCFCGSADWLRKRAESEATS